MKELIKSIAQRLVDHPEQVEVTAIEGNQTTVLELSVADGDMGLRPMEDRFRLRSSSYDPTSLLRLEAGATRIEARGWRKALRGLRLEV